MIACLEETVKAKQDVQQQRYPTYSASTVMLTVMPVDSTSIGPLANSSMISSVKPGPLVTLIHTSGAEWRIRQEPARLVDYL